MAQPPGALPGGDPRVRFLPPPRASVWHGCLFCQAAAKPHVHVSCGFWQVGLDQQTVRLVCTNRRKQFLLDTADVALAE